MGDTNTRQVESADDDYESSMDDSKSASHRSRNGGTDSDNDNAETATLTFASIMDFAIEQVVDEADEFAGDIPNHSGTLLNQRTSELLATLTNIEVAQAHEDAEDPTNEEIRDALAEDAVDILMALGALQWEYDLDIGGAFEARREQMIAMQDADSMQELVEAAAEARGVDPEDLGMPPAPGEGGDGVAPGTDVSEDELTADDDPLFQ